MSVEHDTATGRLRLDRTHFDTLVATLDGGGAAPALARLVDAGVLDADGRPPERLVPALEAAAQPWVVLSVDQVESDGRTWHADVWVGEQVALFLLGPASDAGVGALHEVIVTSVGHVPYGLARLVGMGLRRQAAREPWSYPQARLDDLLDPALREHALSGEQGPVPEALRSEPWRYWVVRSRWEAPDEQIEGRSLHVTDLGSGPLLMTLDEAGERVHWDATTTVAAWKLLTLLLPGDDELARALPRHRAG